MIPPLFTSLNERALLTADKDNLVSLGLYRVLGFSYKAAPKNIALLKKAGRGEPLATWEEEKVAALIRRLTDLWAGMTDGERQQLQTYLIDQPTFEKEKVETFPPFPTPENMRGFSFHTYQNRALHFALSRPRAVLALEMGLGKTLIGLSWAHILNTEGVLDRVTVVAPKSAFSSWIEHLEKFTQTPFKVVAGLTLDKRKTLYDSFYKGQLPLIITTPQTLVIDHFYFSVLAKEKGASTALIIDEAHKAKTEDSKIGLTIGQLSPLYSRVLALTGTPQPNTIGDLYHLVERVNPSSLGEKSEFATRYTYRELDQWDSVKGKTYKAGPLRVDKIKELRAALKESFLAISSLDEDVNLELPQRTDIAPYIPLDPLQREVLKALYTATEERLVNSSLHESNLRGENGLIFQIAGEGATASPQALGVRVEQISISPSLFSPTFSLTYPDYESPKVKFIADHIYNFLNSEGLAVVAFCEHLLGLSILEKALIKRGVNPSLIKQYKGDTSPAERARLIQELNEGGCDVLLGQSRSLETGANLQKRASMVCHLSTPWAPDTLAQTTARVYRQGQRRHVYVLRPSGSRIEEAKNKAIARKLLQSGSATGLNSQGDIAIIETTANKRIRQAHKQVFDKMGYSMQALKALSDFERGLI